MPIKLTITDDHPLIVSGLQNILRFCPSIEVISTYNSGDYLLEGLKTNQPDVLLLDLQMPGLSGPNLVKQINNLYPNIKIIILTGQEASFYAQDMILNGCLGYLLKNTTDQMMLVQAIETVYEGKLFMEPSLKEEVLYGILKVKRAIEETQPTITKRENEVLALISAGLSSKEMADKLFLSIRTIESHRMSLLQKLNVKNTAGLLNKASKLGLIN